MKNAEIQNGPVITRRSALKLFGALLASAAVEGALSAAPAVAAPAAPATIAATCTANVASDQILSSVVTGAIEAAVDLTSRLSPASAEERLALNAA